MPIPGNPHPYGPWFGGINFSKPAEELTQNEIAEGRNVRIGIGGEAQSRKGTTPYNGTAVSGGHAYTACGQHEFSATSSREFAIVGTKFYEGASGTWTDRTGSATITAGADNTWSLADANGTLFGHNGVNGDVLLKWTAAGGNIAAWDVDSRFTWAKSVEFFDNRGWAGNLSSGTDRVWRSDVSDITTWDADGYYDFGSEITGLKKIGTMLAVHTKDTIFGLSPTGNAVTPFRRQPLTNAGTVSNRSLVTIRVPGSGELQLYIRKDGIYAFNGIDSIKTSGRLDGERYWDSINASRLHKSFAVVYEQKNEVWFYIPYGTTQTTMNHILVYDYLRGIFYPPWTGGLNSSLTSAGIVDNVPVSGDESDGFLYKHEEGLNDTDGSTVTAIDSHFKTAASPAMGPDVMLRWLFVRNNFDILGNYEVNITYSSPGIVGQTTTFNQGGGFAAIGAFVIGESSIAPDDLVALEDTDLTGYDPVVQLQYQNANTSEEMSIRRATAIFKPIGRMRKPQAGVT